MKVLQKQITPKYVQLSRLIQIFDLSTDYFKQRMGKDFIEGVHYVIPPNNSKTKRAILWNIEKVENWICHKEIDDELDELLKRR